MVGNLKFFKKAEIGPDLRRMGYFGFIRLEEADMDIYFHGNNCETPELLERGEAVEFWLDDDPRGGLRAVNVRRVATARSITRE
jgi:cold shock CspA family protein